jgi:hypothetical protein
LYDILLLILVKNTEGVAIFARNTNFSS